MASNGKSKLCAIIFLWETAELVNYVLLQAINKCSRFAWNWFLIFFFLNVYKCRHCYENIINSNLWLSLERICLESEVIIGSQSKYSLNTITTQEIKASSPYFSTCDSTLSTGLRYWWQLIVFLCSHQVFSSSMVVCNCHIFHSVVFNFKSNSFLINIQRD